MEDAGTTGGEDQPVNRAISFKLHATSSACKPIAFYLKLVTIAVRENIVVYPQVLIVFVPFRAIEGIPWYECNRTTRIFKKGA